ncbi:MAG: hypothetical protein CM15mP103_00280 [Gammaproteobacteria bacterium]|nr:MAG: hypothetical protein CM15mP103_00280 [Gammaproteobacteria bacterium]
MMPHASSPRWTDLFIKRPVVAVVVCLSLLLVGIRSAIDLPVISFPVIESSSVAIVTAYPGASAETVQGFVTEPIERAASSVPGLDYVESVTTAGTSTVTLWLQLNQDTTEVISTLSTRLSQIRFELPEGTEDPSIQISRADTPYASFYLALRIPPERTYAGVSDLIQRDILPRLAAIPDVERVENYGLEQSMRIWLNPWKMAALDVSTAEVADTLRRNNVIGTFGRTESTSQRVNLKTNSEAKTPADFANMLIQKEGDVDIRLGDVAEIEIGTTELNNVDRYNQDQVVFVGIYPEPGTSEIVVGDALYKAVDEINESLPADLDLFIPLIIPATCAKRLAEIFSTLGETILLVGLVVLALMGSAQRARATANDPYFYSRCDSGDITDRLLHEPADHPRRSCFGRLGGRVMPSWCGERRRNLRKACRERGGTRLFSSATFPHHCHDHDAGGGVCADRIPVWSLGVLFREFALPWPSQWSYRALSHHLSPIMSAWVCPDKGHETRMTRWVNDRFERIAKGMATWSIFRCVGDGSWSQGTVFYHYLWSRSTCSL